VTQHALKVAVTSRGADDFPIFRAFTATGRAPQAMVNIVEPSYSRRPANLYSEADLGSDESALLG
jgi:hypothetical protein